jgi:pyruvate/2-oxoacid:ferredoxin oxidoreductase alpha subunit
MNKRNYATLDRNEAVAYVAYRLNEAIAIYPITPCSPMGELTSAVFHVAARSLAAQGLSIFGDRSNVMSARGAGFALLCSASLQEAHDFALISTAATLESRIPFIHFKVLSFEF